MPKSTGRKKRQREAEQRERAVNGGQEKAQGARNVGEIERTISSALGGALLIGGLKRRSLPGLAIAATGAAFLYRGASGYCKVYEALGVDTYRNSMNADHSIDPPHETARVDHSLEEKPPNSQSRRKQTTKPMSDNKGAGNAATASSFATK